VRHASFSGRFWCPASLTFHILNCTLSHRLAIPGNGNINTNFDISSFFVHKLGACPWQRDGWKDRPVSMAAQNAFILQHGVILKHYQYIYTVFRKKHPLTFRFISLWKMFRILQNLRECLEVNRYFIGKKLNILCYRKHHIDVIFQWV